MIYRVLIDGKEKNIKRRVLGNDRQDENRIREEIINHFLDHEGANEVLILEALDEEES